MSCGKNCKCGKECKNEKRSQIRFEELPATAHNVDFPGEEGKFAVCTIAGNVFIELRICDVPGAEDIVALFPVEYDEDGFQVMVPDYVADLNEKLLRDLDIIPVIVDAEDDEENPDAVVPDESEDDVEEDGIEEDGIEEALEPAIISHIKNIVSKTTEANPDMHFCGAFMPKDGKLVELTDKVATPEECGDIDEVKQLDMLISALKGELDEMQSREKALSAESASCDKECEKPARTAARWTVEDMKLLMAACEKYRGKNGAICWESVARATGRSAEACRNKYGRLSSLA